MCCEVVCWSKISGDLKPGSLKGAKARKSEPSEKLEQVSKHRRFGQGSWARLLRRVFRVDVSRCPRCGSDLEIVSAVTDGDGIARYLEHVGMGDDPPRILGMKEAAHVFEDRI